MADGFALGKTLAGEPLALDPRDLTTHGVVVGMTGSGKTGLGLILLPIMIYHPLQLIVCGVLAQRWGKQS